MTDITPPLPELETSELTKRYIDQPTVDQILKGIHQLHPALFKKIAERENTDTAPDDDVTREFFRILREEFNVRGDLRIQTSLFWEARRRSWLMYGVNLKGRPLVWLELDRTTKPVVDQSTVDQVLTQIFDERPDLFRRLAACELTRRAIYEVAHDFRGQFRRILQKPDLAVQGSLLLEARRRVRVMLGMKDLRDAARDRQTT
jgi:hypothetical protein